MIIRGGTAAGGGAGGGASAEPENLPCPRCESTNTKFCYYNNYNLSQPRYFCKACRRYWTRGGTLRNIPFGGGHRKKRPLSSSPSPARPRRPPPSPPPPATLSHSPGGASFSTLLGLGGERMMSGSGGGFLGLDYGHGLGVLGLDENMGLGLGFGKVEWPPLVVDPIPTAEDDGDAGVCSGDLPDSGGDCFPWPEQGLDSR